MPSCSGSLPVALRLETLRSFVADISEDAKVLVGHILISSNFIELVKRLPEDKRSGSECSYHCALIPEPFVRSYMDKTTDLIYSARFLTLEAFSH